VLALLVREEEWRELSPLSRYLSSIYIVGAFGAKRFTNTALSYFSPMYLCACVQSHMKENIIGAYSYNISDQMITKK